MTYTKKTNHVEEGLDNLIDQFKDKPKIEATASAYLEQIQDLENMFSDLRTETTIDTAVGQHLDNIGAIVGEPRSGRDDPQYRTAIKARIQLNTSGGTIEDVVALAIAVADASVTIGVTEFYPAGFILDIVDPIDPLLVNVERIASFVASGRGGGVGGFLNFHTAGAFQYDGPAGTGYDEGEYGGTEVA